MNPETARRIRSLTTPHLADACLRLGLAVRCAPAGTVAATPGSRLAGRACPARHVGSVDVFLDALAHAEPGDVLVVDNDGRLDESCVGDLIALEMLGAGLAGIVIWGLHRDSADIRAIGLPVFSLGTIPTGPQRLDARPDDVLSVANVGAWSITSADLVVGDDDGVLFLPADRITEIITIAESIRDTERRQAAMIAEGRSLREQVAFDQYIAARAADPGLTFRAHLRSAGGAVEE